MQADKEALMDEFITNFCFKIQLVLGCGDVMCVCVCALLLPLCSIRFHDV